MKTLYLLSLLVIFSLNLFCQTDWTKHPDPVLVNGSSGEWDVNLDYIGSVIFSNDTYMMWYSGWPQSRVWAIGLASSEDGITWTKDANNPVFGAGPEGSWDQDYVSCGAVTIVDDTFHMWYTGYKDGYENTALGHATSADGINWERDPANPVLTVEPEGDWKYEFVWVDEVIFTGNEFHMWYAAGDLPPNDKEGAICHATSPDGSNWIRDSNNPVLEPGEPEEWDNPSIGFTSVIFDGARFHMWYAGGKDPDDHIYDIGYAISTDGSDWDKYTGNPVMKKGPGGSWDNRSVFAPNVIDSAGVKYKMWYNGRPPGSDWGVKFGYAETYEPAWMELTPMDIRLGEAISASIDSVIYVFGGSDAQLNEVSSARAFDTKANSWSMLADIPYELSYGNAEASNGKVYVLGGWYNDNGSPATRASTLEYDPSGDSYLEKAPSPEPNGTAATCILEDTIYIFGGTSTPTPQNQNKAWYYVPDTDSWGALPGMIHGRPGGASAEIIDRKIYVMGGTEEAGWSNPTTSVEVYDPALGTWSVLADMPVPAAYPASTVYDNKILLFGGDSSVNIDQGHYGISIGTDLVQSYDPASDTWTMMKGMPFTRTGMASERVENYIYFIGGFPNGRDLAEPLNEVWRFNLDSLEEWVVPCSEVLISQESLTLKVDSTYVLTACALPTYAVDRTISWSSSDEGIARVSNEGEVIAVSMGEASITATAAGGGCTASCSVSVSPGVGLTNWKAIQISVLPNPVTDILVIKTNLQDGHTVEITSLNGQVIYRRTMDRPTNEIDLSSLEKGAYFITIRSKDLVTTRKIIKL